MSDTKKGQSPRTVVPPLKDSAVSALVDAFPNLDPHLLAKLNHEMKWSSPRSLGRQLRDLFNYALFPSANGFDASQLEDLSGAWKLMVLLCDAPPTSSEMMEDRMS